jgi:dTDP-4-dehydrorhamnose 3,5-epimerase
MKFRELVVGGTYLVEPEPARDDRGFFARTFCIRELEQLGAPLSIVQSSISYNEIRGTLRGMHYQREPYGEVKLVRCTQGAILDVVVDVREGSPTYLAFCAEELSADNRRALYIPRGCAHGFLTLTDGAEVLYDISAFYRPEAAAGLRWDDPAIGIKWPFSPVRVSARDNAYPLLPARGTP